MIFKPKALHISVSGRNYGDTVLNLAIQSMIKPVFRVRHHDILKDKFRPDSLKRFQKHNIIIFGGGGLIHSYNPHGEPWPLTGTMWNMPLDEIRQLKPRIVLYGVGYNHFYREPGPTEAMHRFFDVLMEKDALIGFRNDGSLPRIVEHIPQLDGYATTVPDPGVFFRVKTRRQGGVNPAILQIATDRMHLRYGEHFDYFLETLRQMKLVSPVPFLLVPHTPDDAKLYTGLAETLDLEVFPFKASKTRAKRAIEYYANAPFSVTTRGHGQIFSIGNNTPNFSISTHPKVTAFAENCGQSEWCINHGQRPIGEVLHRFQRFLSSLDVIHSELRNLNATFDANIARFNRQIYQLVLHD